MENWGEQVGGVYQKAELSKLFRSDVYKENQSDCVANSNV